MADRFHIAVKGIREAAQRARSRADKLHLGMRAVNARAAVLLFQWVMRNFRAEGRLHDSASLHWPPLAPSTKLARIRRNLRTGRRGRNIRSRIRALPIGAGVTPMLVDTGTLRGGFVPRWTSRQAILENYVPYARVHEEGTTRIPKRKMLPAPTQAIQIVRPVYGEHVRLSVR